MRKEKNTKISQVLKHLQTCRSITQKEAIDLYGAYRLADIIYKLKRTGYHIVTLTESIKDRNGRDCHYARYVMKTVEG